MNRDLMEKAGFKKEMKMVENRQCPLCGEKINTNDFKNDISIKEFTISGMCQKCQDKIFGKDDEYEIN